MLATSPSSIALDRLGATSHLDESEACPQISPIEQRIEDEEINPRDRIQLGYLADTISDELSYSHIENAGIEPIQTYTRDLQDQLTECGLDLRVKFIETSIDGNLAMYYDHAIWENLASMYWDRYVDPVDFVSLATEARLARSENALRMMLNPFYYYSDFRENDRAFNNLMGDLSISSQTQWAQLTCHHKRAVLNFWETQGFELKDLVKFDYQNQIPSFVYPNL